MTDILYQPKTTSTKLTWIIDQKMTWPTFFFDRPLGLTAAVCQYIWTNSNPTKLINTSSKPIHLPRPRTTALLPGGNLAVRPVCSFWEQSFSSTNFFTELLTGSDEMCSCRWGGMSSSEDDSFACGVCLVLSTLHDAAMLGLWLRERLFIKEWLKCKDDSQLEREQTSAPIMS